MIVVKHRGLGLLGFIFWIFGLVVAKGFWSTFFAFIFFPYSYYLGIVHLCKVYGIL